MTKDEYAEKLKEIDRERDKQLYRLDRDYAMQFKQAGICDIIACSNNERLILVDVR